MREKLLTAWKLLTDFSDKPGKPALLRRNTLIFFSLSAGLIFSQAKTYNLILKEIPTINDLKTVNGLIHFQKAPELRRTTGYYTVIEPDHQPSVLVHCYAGSTFTNTCLHENPEAVAGKYATVKYLPTSRGNLLFSMQIGDLMVINYESSVRKYSENKLDITDYIAFALYISLIYCLVRNFYFNLKSQHKA